jgi:uncharacterized protein
MNESGCRTETHQGAGRTAGQDYVPALPNLLIEPGAPQILRGQRCGACQAVIAGYRLACPACGNRDRIEHVNLAASGTVQAHTVVHRSYPGVKTPFVAAAVALDGGGTVRGTITDIDPLAPLPDEMRVRMVFRDTGQRDAQGRHFISYFFVPAET